MTHSQTTTEQTTAAEQGQPSTPSAPPTDPHPCGLAIYLWLRSCLDCFIEYPVIRALRRVRHQLIIPLILVAIATVDPLGLNESSSRISHNVANLFSSHRYSSAAQDEITVVLIDEDTLRHMRQSWPMDHGAYAEILKPILEMRPRAVFLDIVLGEKRGSERQARLLQRTIRDAAHVPHDGDGRTTPVFLADYNGHAPEMVPCEPVAGGRAYWTQRDSTLDELVCASTQTAPIHWSGYKGFYPLSVPWAKPGDGQRETPAMLLYGAYCDGADRPCPVSRDSPDWRKTFEAPLAVWWGAVPSRQMGRINDECRDEREALAGRLSGALYIATRVFWGKFDDGSIGCPYSDTVHAHLLLGDPDTVRRQLAPLFKDRLVLVGTDLRAGTDLTRSPVHGQLPGVYLHAMALDNLIAWGAGYMREPGSLLELSQANVVEGAALLAVYVLSMLIRRRFLRMLGRPPRYTRLSPEIARGYDVLVFKLRALGLLAVPVLAAVWAYSKDWPPLNYIGLVALSGLALSLVFSLDDQVAGEEDAAPSPQTNKGRS